MAPYQVAIIGSGPGGYVAAFRAADLGLKTVVIEDAALGGICLNVGCIPTKLMIRSTEVYSLARHAAEFGVKAEGLSIDWSAVIARKDKAVELLRKGIAGQFKGRHIDLVEGRARLAGKGRIQVTGKGTEHQEIQAEKIIIATGSVPVEIPAFKFDHERILNSDDLTRRQELPTSILIVGGGYIGCEFATMLAEAGVMVTLVEMLDHLLLNMDEDLQKAAFRTLKKLKVDIRASTTVQSIESTDSGIVAHTSDGKTVESEVALVAVGRAPHSKDLGLDVAGVETDRRGSIGIDEHCRTNVTNVYAIGDVTGKVQLAHVASRQGIIAAEDIAGKPEARIDYGKVPGVIFTHPEMASIGLSEAEARQKNEHVKVARFQQQILGRDLAEGSGGGFVKIVGDESTGEILGVHIAGHRATDLIEEASVAITAELLVEDLAAAIHAHPTFSEGLMEAAEMWLGRGIHAK